MATSLWMVLAPNILVGLVKAAMKYDCTQGLIIPAGFDDRERRWIGHGLTALFFVLLLPVGPAVSGCFQASVHTIMKGHELDQRNADDLQRAMAQR